MVVNIIIVAITLLMGVFVSVWLVSPRGRTWIEVPKHQPTRWDA